MRDRNEFRRLVRRGYDRLAERGGSRWADLIRRPDKAKYAGLFVDALPPGSRVLELGCGPGGSTTRKLGERFRLTGVDLSRAQLRLARRNVPRATFVQADMASIQFRPASLDGVAAFFSLIHVPAPEQPALFRSIHRWLKPGGLLVCTLATDPAEEQFTDDFLGVPMLWGSLGVEAGRAAVADAGLRIEVAAEETAPELGRPVTFLWIVARKETGSGEE